jgi:precorrin-2/cobalt-factor-2 C20-methyltransferase
VGRHSQRVASILRKLDLFDQAGYVAHATLPDQKVQRLADVALDSIPYFSMVLVHKTGAI